MSKNITPLVVGNWKMNGLQKNHLSLVDDLISLSQKKSLVKAEIAICPPFTLTAIVNEKIQNTQILLGAQDCHEENSGAYTGSISAQMLEEFSCKYVILGHSERRTFEREISERISNKASSVHCNDMKAIICVGESLEEREANQTIQIIDRQLQLSVPPSATPENTIIAYEPIWAIGTGRTATLDQISEVHAAIKSLTHSRSPNFSGAFSVLYGGSVKPSNAADILNLENVNGALVGGASLNAKDFWDIAAAANDSVKEPSITSNKP